MNSNNRIAATLYSLGTVCLRNISTNTLHKGDDDDDDDDDDNKFAGNLFQQFIFQNPLLVLFQHILHGSSIRKQTYLVRRK